MSLIKPNHTSNISTDQDTNTIMNTASFNTQTLSPLGDLSVFPREIRDEIYRHLFSNKFYSWSDVIGCARSDRVSPYCYSGTKCNDWRVSTLSIFCLSKAIKEEAMALLYSKATFSFRDKLKESNEEVQRHPSIDSMTNIRLFYRTTLESRGDSLHHDPEYGPEIYGSAHAGHLCFFLGDTIMRKSILVQLELGKSWRDATKMTTSPLFAALEQLTGFETVTLSLTVGYDGYTDWPYAEEWGEFYVGFEIVLREMSKYLEPTLGQSSEMSKLEPEEIGPSLRYRVIREVVFHPRAHRAAISKAKQDK